MNVKITFEDNNGMLNGILSLGGEWPFPALPRIGEEISPSLLKEWITPHELFEALTDEEKAMWVRWVSEDVEAGSQEEEAQQDNRTTCTSGWQTLAPSCPKYAGASTKASIRCSSH